MTIGITGAAGFLGANVLRHLADLHGRRHRIVPYYSTRSGNPLTDDLHPAYEHLDVTSLRDVRRRTRHLDVLLHVAGRVDFSRRGARRTWEVNVLGTRNVLEAALANGIRRVVCVSSICVVGPAPEGRRVRRRGRRPVRRRRQPHRVPGPGRCPRRRPRVARRGLDVPAADPGAVLRREARGVGAGAGLPPPPRRCRSCACSRARRSAPVTPAWRSAVSWSGSSPGGCGSPFRAPRPSSRRPTPRGASGWPRARAGRARRTSSRAASATT